MEITGTHLYLLRDIECWSKGTRDQLDRAAGRYGAVMSDYVHLKTLGLIKPVREGAGWAVTEAGFKVLYNG